MPKWVVYCGQCNRPSTYNQIDDSTIDLAAPAAKKPPTSGEGGGVGMPLVQAKVAVRDLRSDVQPRVIGESANSGRINAKLDRRMPPNRVIVVPVTKLSCGLTSNHFAQSTKFRCVWMGTNQMTLMFALSRLHISVAQAGGLLPGEGRSHEVPGQCASVVEASSSARAWLLVYRVDSGRTAPEKNVAVCGEGLPQHISMTATSSRPTDLSRSREHWLAKMFGFPLLLRRGYTCDVGKDSVAIGALLGAIAEQLWDGSRETVDF